MEFGDYKDGKRHGIQGKSQGKTRLQLDGEIRLAAINLTIAQAIEDCRDDVVSRYIVHHGVQVANVRPGDRIAPAA